MLYIAFLIFIQVFRYLQDIQGTLTKTGYILGCVPTVVAIATTVTTATNDEPPSLTAALRTNGKAP